MKVHIPGEPLGGRTLEEKNLAVPATPLPPRSERHQAVQEAPGTCHLCPRDSPRGVQAPCEAGVKLQLPRAPHPLVVGRAVVELGDGHLAAVPPVEAEPLRNLLKTLPVVIGHINLQRSEKHKVLGSLLADLVETQ